MKNVIITGKKSILLVSILTMMISFYNEKNSACEMLLSEKTEGAQNIERVYKLEKENYKIVFNSNNLEFTKFINN